MESGGIRVRDLKRYYMRGPHEVRALDGVDLDIETGEFIGIVGSSGSGKSTLLNLLAGLDTPTSGTIEVDGNSLAAMNRRELARYRAKRVGMVFQAFHLINHLSAVQNVEMALLFDGTPAQERRTRATDFLERLGLGDRLDHRPADLSGGEQQRVAFARALASSPEILFADEPTGNLDEENAQQIAQLLQDQKEKGLIVILVTHDLQFASQQADRTIRLHYGRVDAGESVS